MVNDRPPSGSPFPTDPAADSSYAAYSATPYGQSPYGGYETGGYPVTGYDGYSTGSYDSGSYQDPTAAAAYGGGDPLFGTLPDGQDTGGHPVTTGYDTGSYATTPYDVANGGYDTGTYAQQAYPSGAYDPAGYDTGVWDATAWDTGVHPAAAYDAAMYDTGAYDAGVYDASAYDTGAYETQSYETGAYDARAYDGSPYETGAYDTGTYDTSAYDTGAYANSGHDTGTYDSGVYGTGAYGTTAPDPAAYSTGSWGTAAAHADDGQQITGLIPQQYAPQHSPGADWDSGAYGLAHETGPLDGHDTPGWDSGAYDTTAYDPAAYETGAYETAAYEAAAYDPAPHEGSHHQADDVDRQFEALTADLPDSEAEPEPVAAVRTREGAPLPNRGRRRSAKPRRSALLTVAVPSVCVLGVAGIAAASVTSVTGEEDSGSDEKTTQAAPDTASAEPSPANDKLDTQLAGLSAADDFANRASRTQERIDLKERKEAERVRKAEAAAAKEAARPKFAAPVDGTGISAYYGQAGINWMSVHSGIDFPASYGTAVKAATDGTVSTKWGGSYGNMAIVTAEDGTETWYCHLSSTKIRSGSVKAGDVIAYSGNSGNSTGPHLHFEVRPGGGSAIDPLPWFRSHGIEPG